jgi:hypothetical protein
MCSNFRFDLIDHTKSDQNLVKFNYHTVIRSKRFQPSISDESFILHLTKINSNQF